MDRNKWLPKLPLFGLPSCVYCGAPADTSDHTPPRCFLPRKLPETVQAMTVPACRACNASYSNDEVRAAAVICTVSFTEADRKAIAKGGWIHSALQHDNKLRLFIEERLGLDGVFRVDAEVLNVFDRITKKTAVGLLFFEFGKIVKLSTLTVVTMDHAKNVPANALVESHRRTDHGFAEVTPSCRELERQVKAFMGLEPPHMPKWRVFIPEYFEYMFIMRSNRKLMCAMKIHDALTVLLECPWPSEAGPRRVGTKKVRRKP